MTGGGAGDGNDTTTLSILVVNEYRNFIVASAALSTITFLFIFLVAFVFIRFLGANVNDDGGSADMTTTVEKKSTRPDAVGQQAEVERVEEHPDTWVRDHRGPGSRAVLLMVSTSFRPVAFTYDTSLWPTNATWDNYKTAFDTSLGNNFGQSLINSVIIAGISTLIGVAVGVFASYALARLEFKGKYLVLGFVLAASMFPGVAAGHAAVPVLHRHRLVRHLPGADHPEHLVRAAADHLHPDGILQEMPTFEEAAKIDGATPGQAFRKVILPPPLPACSRPPSWRPSPPGTSSSSPASSATPARPR